MTNPKKNPVWLERIGYVIGLMLALAIWIALTMFHARADTGISEQLPFVTVSMLFATIIGAVGSFLAFGEDKKFPPSATSVGHILLGFGAGLFFTRGSLELMGYLTPSDNVVICASFFWAGLGYFILRLAVSIVQDEAVIALLPGWLARMLGVKNDNR